MSQQVSVSNIKQLLELLSQVLDATLLKAARPSRQPYSIC
jgi:hypothetical protein